MDNTSEKKRTNIISFGASFSPWQPKKNFMQSVQTVVF
jgi:hypothetical protein